MASSRLNAEGNVENMTSDTMSDSTELQGVGPRLWNPNTLKWEKAPTFGAGDNATPQNVPLVGSGLLNQTGAVDRARNNQYDVVALASEARTETTTSPVQINYNFSKLFIRLVATGPVGTGTLQVAIGANNGTIAEFVPVTPSGEGNIHWYEAAPGLKNAAETGAVTATPMVYAQTVNLFVPRQFTLAVVHSNSSSWTYELAYGLTL